MQSAVNRATNKATARILAVLSTFATDRPSVGVTELSDRLGMTKNMAFRALTTLVEQGYLVRDASGKRYELGYRVVELQNPNFDEPDLRTLCLPYLQRLHELTRETVLLSIRVGDYLVVIDGIEGKGTLVNRVRLGLVLPLHVSSASRAVLAALEDSEIEAYLAANQPLKRATATTITEPKQLWEEINQVREQGYALGYGDSTPDRISLSFAVLDAEQRAVAAVTVGGPLRRLTRDKLLVHLSNVKRIVAELNLRTSLYQTALPHTSAGLRNP